MPDAGEIKAKVTIEYDGSGIEKAKEDLASLAESTGGIGGSTEEATSKLADFGTQAEASAGSAKTLNSALVDLPKIVEGGGSAISSATEALDEHRQVVEDTASAYENLQEPVAQVTKRTQSMNDAWGEAGRNFQVFQEAYNSVDSSGMYNAADSMQMVYDHLDKTGQSIEDFSSSIGGKNAQLFHEMSTDWAQMNASIDTAGSSFEAVGKSANEGFGAVSASAADADKAVAGFLGKTTASVKEMQVTGLGDIFGGATEGMMGMLNDIAMPLMAIQMVGMAVQAVGQSIYDSAAIAEGPAAHSLGTFTGTVDALGQSAQRLGSQFSESFGQQLLPTLNAMNYQASQSEGGGIGGFLGGLTSTVASLWQIGTGSNVVGGTEGLVNQVAASMGLQQPFQGPGPTSKYQQQMAQLPQTVQANAQQLQYQSSLTLAEAVDPNYLAAQNQMSASQRAAQYLVDSYNVSHPPPSQYDLIQTARYNAYAAQQEKNYQYQMDNPSGPTYGQSLLGNIGAGNWGGAWSDLTGANGDRWTQSWQSQGGAFNSIGDFFAAWGNNFMHGGEAPYSVAPRGGPPDVGGLFGGIGQDLSSAWNWLTNPSPYPALPPQSSTGGCFIAGTRVLMADGSEKPIETLQIGEQVASYDGTKQVYAIITDRITFPAKQTYELTFSDGKSLVTTDSHPLASLQGWKSISPESTSQENPGLPVTALEVGDSIYTVDGTPCRLVSIQKREITTVFNITVDASHTYYASGILVHNAKLNTHISEEVGQQTADQIGSITLPHIDLSGLTAGLTSAFSGLSLPHIDLSGLTAGLSSMFSGISLPAIPNIGSQISSELGSMFSGISMPSIPDLGGMINGAMSSMFGGISVPSIPDLGGMLNGAMSGMFGSIAVPSAPDVGAMIDGAMSGMFGGVQVPSAPDVGAMIDGAMTGMFSGITIPSPPDLGSQISASMIGMFSGISIPSVPRFASGVSNFSGGAAVVGEAGMEAVEYGGRYALFDQGAAFVNLPAGSSVYPLQDMSSYSSPHTLANGTGGGGFSPISLGGGGSMPQSINVSVHLDSQTILSAIGMPLAQTIRVAGGMRGF